MESRQPAPKQHETWPRIAGAAGIVLAIVLTAAIWFLVIDRQATAMQRGEAIVTPIVPLGPGSYNVEEDVVDEVVDDGERSPIP